MRIDQSTQVHERVDGNARFRGAREPITNLWIQHPLGHRYL
jgi:hypothetical protein